MTNISDNKLGIGNPLALHRGKKLGLKSWQHLRVLSYRGLIDLFEKNGFKVEAIKEAGYYPLPNLFAKLDPRHSAFLTIKARKK